MILVDTSVWIDHLRMNEPQLVSALTDDAVACHPYLIEEMALGSIRQRNVVLELLASLHMAPTLTHAEVMTLVDAYQLWSRGLSAVDVHLLGSVLLMREASLWTRDKRLIAACQDVGVKAVDPPASR